MHPCIIGFDWNWAAALPLLLCPHWWIGILIPLFFSGGGAIVIFFTIVLPFGFNTFRVYRHLKTEQGQMLDLQGKAASEIKTNASFRVPSSRSLVAGDANTIHDVEHAGEDFDDLPPPAYEEVMETESNGAYGGDWRVRAVLGRTATFMLKPDTALPNNTNNSSLAAISTNNRIFPFALVTNMGAILAIVVFFTSKTLAGNLLLMLALAFYYGHNLLPLCLGENFQPEEWHFMTKAVMNLDDVKAAVDRDKTKEPSVVFRGVKWHSETRGSGKNRKTVRVETGSDNRTMLIPGVTDVSDDIPEAEFRKYSLIKLTIIRSWEAGTGHRLRMLTLLLIKAHAHRPPLPCFICFLFLLLTIQPFAEEGSEDYFKEQRDRFKQEANTDSEFDYSEFFSLGDLPVHQLLKNNARPSCLLNKYAYGICILFLLAWPWKMYFELCTVQGTIRVRKELTRNGETQSNEV